MGSAILDRMAKHRILSREEERALVEKAQAGDLKARDELVLCNIRFILREIRKRRNGNSELDDLVQEAVIGLMKAIERWDSSRGTRLMTYAVWWIRSYIGNQQLRDHSLLKCANTGSVRANYYSLKRKVAALTKEGKTTDEALETIAKKGKWRAEQLKEVLDVLSMQTLSLDTPVANDRDETFKDWLEDEQRPVDEQLELEQQSDIAVEALLGACGRDIERTIVSERIMADDPARLSQIGEQFGICRERVRQIESTLIKRAKRTLCVAQA